MPEQTEILIKRKADGTGDFPAVECTQSQLVFWRNGDPKSPHWPSIPGNPPAEPRFQVGSGDNSDPVQPYASQNAIPQGQSQVVNYSCKISGHQGEQGKVTVWADFLVAQFQGASGAYNEIDGTVGKPLQQVLTTGGKAPYMHTLSDAALPRGVTVTNGPIGVMASGTPAAAGQNFAFTVHGKDALGNKVDQTFTIVIQRGAEAVT